MVSETPSPIEPQDLRKSEVVFTEDGFSLTRITYELGPFGLIELNLREANAFEDILFINIYDEGYFAVTWKTPANIEDFLSAADAFYSEVDLDQNPEKPYKAIIIPREGSTDDIFPAEYIRPFKLADLKNDGLQLDTNVDDIGIFRLEDPKGDVVYDALDNRYGVIVYSEEKSIDTVTKAVSNLVNKTQPQIPTEIITKTLGFIPHNITSNS